MNENAKEIRVYLRSLPVGALFVYPGTPITAPIFSAYGHAIYRNKYLKASVGKFLLRAKVYNVEITEAVRELEVALEVRGGINVKLLLNNLEAVKGLASGITNSSPVDLWNFIGLQDSIRNRGLLDTGT